MPECPELPENPTTPTTPALPEVWDGCSISSGAALSSGITFKEQDGSPTHTGITTVEVNQADGFVLTQPSTNTVLISIQDASASQVGIVSTGTQTFAGLKTFQDTTTFKSTVLLYDASGSVTSTYITTISANFTGWTVGLNPSAFVYGSIALTYTSGVVRFTLSDDNTIGVEPAYAISIDNVVYTGDSGTDALGNVYKGGICTTVGSGSVGTGTVTSVDVSGGTTGLTTSGGPVTGSGTITLSGTLAVANGGTGVTSLASLNAADFGSGAATDGYVLTADGAGGADWEALPAGYTDEMARDAIGLALVAGAGIGIVVNDGADTITIACSVTQYTDEMARDAVGAALTTTSLIKVTADDSGDMIVLEKTIRGCRAYQSGTGSIGSPGGWVSIALNTEDWKSDTGYHDNTTNNTRMTVPSGRAGLYRGVAFLYPNDGVGSPAGTVYQLRLLLNNTTVLAACITEKGAAGAFSVCPIEFQHFLGVGDYVELQVYYTSPSGAYTHFGNNILCFFEFTMEGVAP